eukprot:s108_g42.t1
MNHGKILKYTEALSWLQSCLSHMPRSMLEERRRMLESLTGDNEMSEDDESPRFNVDRDARQWMIQSHGDAHGHLALRLLLQQRCLFPMVPREPAQVCEARAQALDFPGGAPHLCIFPSLAGLSATVADDTLFVNPGFLCKSAALGSFAELWIAPGGDSMKDRIRVDVKKLE